MRCAAKNRFGQPCKRNARPGSDKCGPHCGLQDMKALGSTGGRHKKMNATLPSKTIVDFETFAWALGIALEVPQGKRSVDTALDLLKVICDSEDELDRVEAILSAAMPMPVSRW
jgi:hypothetical protein